MNMEQEIQKTLEAYRRGAAPRIGLLSPDVQKDWAISAGFQAYNLQPVALLMFPQLTPIRNMTSRMPGKGKKAEYKAVTALNSALLTGWTAEGSAASTVTTTTVDRTATYKTFALGDKVTFESQWAGVGFTDVKALAVTNLLRAAMIAEENAILFGQRNGEGETHEQRPGAIGTPTAPTAVDGGATPVSNFANVSYDVCQTVVTGAGESTASAAAAVTPTATHPLVITPVKTATATQPVLGYNIYVRTTSGPGAWKKVVAGDIYGNVAPTTGTFGGVSWITNGEAITLDTIPTTATVPPVSEPTSALQFNGIYPQMTGASPICPNLIDVDGVLSLTKLNQLFQSMWDNARADPDGLWCNAQESIKITSLTLGSGTPYHVVVTDGGAASANYRVARLTNPVTGTEVPVKVHPTIPQGLMLALSSKLPSWYVPTDIPTVWAMDLAQDYVEIDYPPAVASPYWQVEVRFYGALKLYIPALQGALRGINIS